jgi:hypothetical protein
MRKRLACLVAAVAVIAVSAAPVSAAPEVSFKARLVPVSGYPETGNLYGGGAAVAVEYRITGSEYEQSPPPLAGIKLQLPQGFHLNNEGWRTCSKSPLEPELGPGSGRCGPSSYAGPPGTVQAFVSLGGVRESEVAALESVRAPDGSVHFFIDGHNPLSLEIFSVGEWMHMRGGAGFGPELAAEVPLVESLPGGPFASIGGIQLQLGAARGPSSPHRATYYLEVPRRGMCPRGGFRMKTETIFAAIAGLPRHIVTRGYRMPCPGRSARR